MQEQAYFIFVYSAATCQMSRIVQVLLILNWAWESTLQNKPSGKEEKLSSRQVSFYFKRKFRLFMSVKLYVIRYQNILIVINKDHREVLAIELFRFVLYKLKRSFLKTLWSSHHSNKELTCMLFLFLHIQKQYRNSVKKIKKFQNLNRLKWIYNFEINRWIYCNKHNKTIESECHNNNTTVSNFLKP